MGCYSGKWANDLMRLKFLHTPTACLNFYYLIYFVSISVFNFNRY
jgi:hypothetical protein